MIVLYPGIGSVTARGNTTFGHGGLAKRTKLTAVGVVDGLKNKLTVRVPSGFKLRVAVAPVNVIPEAGMSVIPAKLFKLKPVTITLVVTPDTSEPGATAVAVGPFKQNGMGGKGGNGGNGQHGLGGGHTGRGGHGGGGHTGRGWHGWHGL